MCVAKNDNTHLGDKDCAELKRSSALSDHAPFVDRVICDAKALDTINISIDFVSVTGQTRTGSLLRSQRALQ